MARTDSACEKIEAFKFRILNAGSYIAVLLYFLLILLLVDTASG